MACRYDLLGNRIIQHTGLFALLDEHQVLNVALRAFDGAEIQSAHDDTGCSGIAHRIVENFAVGGRVADDTVFAHLLAASLELRLDEADTQCLGRFFSVLHREDMMQ